MEQIKVEGLELIGKGVTASVYILDTNKIIKVFRDVVPFEQIQKEYDCAKLVENAGIRTPRAQKIVETEGGIGIVYDRVNGITLSAEIQKNKDKLYEYGFKYGELVSNLHSKKVLDTKIKSAKDTFKGLFKECGEWINDSEKQKIFSLIEAVPDEKSLLHGDIAPVNIMIENGQLIIIDVPTIMVGHPIFDLLQPYTFCKETTDLFDIYLAMTEEEKNSPVGHFLSRFESRYLTHDQSDEVWAGFIKGYFGTRTDQEIKAIEDTLKLYNSIKSMGAVYMRNVFGDEVVSFMVKRGRDWLKTHSVDNKNIDFAVFDR